MPGKVVDLGQFRRLKERALREPEFRKLVERISEKTEDLDRESARAWFDREIVGQGSVETLLEKFAKETDDAR